MAAVLGCADSRCPVELMFNVSPGDIFVCRNAGNAIAKAEGSVVASMEYCMAHLQTKLLVVLGHTKCGALNGALASIPAADAAPKPDASMLEQYLVALTPAAKKAKAELPFAPDKDVAELAIRINVKNTMRSILEVSEPLRKQWESGDLMMEGAIYDITTGKVEFIGGPQKTGNAEPTERPNFSAESNPCCRCY
jgi:carbonic anhydrase